MNGKLYICATPIGNLDDITIRVINILKQCDIIAAEDTRHTLKLLNHFGISTPLTSYHEHNKRQKGYKLIEMLKDGKNIALVSDAGMPAISDPGADIVSLCYCEGIEVTVAPGASAALTALILSGIDTRRFVFEGFLPYDKKERKEILESLKKEVRTIIIYESPHRLLNTINELSETFGGQRVMSCVREITKKHEEVLKDTISNHILYFQSNAPRGEYVIVIQGADKNEIRAEEICMWEDIDIKEHMAIYINKGMSEKEAMKAVANDRGVSKRDIYSIIKK